MLDKGVFVNHQGHWIAILKNGHHYIHSTLDDLLSLLRSLDQVHFFTMKSLNI